MTLTRRVIVCLDVAGDRVVKGVRFESLRDAGDPAELAERYERDGADEITFLDVSASAQRRATLLDVVRRTAERLFIPLTVGGGVRSAEDAALVLRSGADKVAVNSAAVERPELLSELARRFGSQCVVASIDAKRESGGWTVYTRGATSPTGREVAAWARECVERGAGEILLTSIDRDGTKQGYDLDLTSLVAETVDVPVIASGGAGRPEDVRAALEATGADAALVAGMLHRGESTIGAIKSMLNAANVPVRLTS